MLTNLVTYQECYEHLRLDYDSDGSADDAWLAVFVPAISEAIASWVKVEEKLYVPEYDSSGKVELDSDDVPVPALDSDGVPTVKPQVKAAALLEISSQYRYREGEGKDNQMQDAAGYVLSKGATALLTPLRSPTVA